MPVHINIEGYYANDDMDCQPSDAEVENAIKALSNGKAAGEDDIPDECFKYGGAAMIRQIQRFLSKVWALEVIPNNWRKAIALPFHKKGDKSNCANYRGISILDVGFKILEAVIANRLKRHRDPLMINKRRAIWLSKRA